MATETLKVKVLFGWGLIVAIIASITAPEAVEALAPFLLCVLAINATCYFPEMLSGFKKSVASKKPRRPHATKEPRTQAQWVEHIDYENYLIPSYLRKQGGVQ